FKKIIHLNRRLKASPTQYRRTVVTKELRMKLNNPEKTSLLSVAALTLLVLCYLSAPALAQMDGQIKSESASSFKVTYYPTKVGIGTRDVAPANDGTVWFAAQFDGTVGNLDPKTGKFKLYPLGPGSSPHGINMGPDGNLWVLDGGQNAIIRMNSSDHKLTVFSVPKEKGNLNLNTGVFDHSGVLWFTGENGYYGRLEPGTSKMEIFDAPRGAGPYGITVTPQGTVW